MQAVPLVFDLQCQTFKADRWSGSEFCPSFLVKAIFRIPDTTFIYLLLLYNTACRHTILQDWDYSYLCYSDRLHLILDTATHAP